VRYSKKFIDLGKANVIVIPMVWVKSEELKHKKKMVGVHMDINGTIEINPMWEDEK